MKFLVCFAALLVCASGAVRRLGLSQDGTYWPERHQQGNQRLLGLSQDGTYWPDRFQNGRQLFGLTQDDTQGGKRLLGLSQDGTYWPEKSQGGKRLLGLSQDGTYWPEKSQGGKRLLGLSLDGTYWPEKAQGGKRLLGLSQDGTYWPEKSQGGKRLLGLSQDGTYWPEKAQGGKRLLGLSQDGTYWPEKSQGGKRLLGLSQDGTYWPERSGQADRHHTEGQNGHHQYGMSSNPAAFVEPDDVPVFSDSADAEETVQQAERALGLSQDGTYWPEQSQRSDRRRPEGQHGRHFYGYSHNPASAAGANHIKEMNVDVDADGQHHQQRDGQQRLLGLSQDGTYWPHRSGHGRHGGKRVEGVNGRHFYGMSYNPASAAQKEQQSQQ